MCSSRNLCDERSDKQKVVGDLWLAICCCRFVPAVIRSSCPSLLVLTHLHFRELPDLFHLVILDSLLANIPHPLLALRQAKRGPENC